MIKNLKKLTPFFHFFFWGKSSPIKKMLMESTLDIYSFSIIVYFLEGLV
jgi:hypothetical protein